MGGVPTHGKLVDMTTLCAIDNALLGNLGFATTPEIAGKLMQTLIALSAGSDMIWKGNQIDGQINGYQSAASNQISKKLGAGDDEHGIVFGNFNDLLIGIWGAMEITVDPLTLADKGLIKITSFQMVDVMLRHPESFCVATGAKPA